VHNAHSHLGSDTSSAELRDPGADRDPPPVPAHYGHLDGWRGLAIGFLLLGHFYPVPGINFGTVGVNFFFVLSGWLMARLLFEQEVPIPTFYRRRISRIVPAQLTFVTAVVVWFALGGRSIDWTEVAAAALFVNNYVQATMQDATMPFGHIWSLCVEEHSYIILSLVAVAARRRWLRPKYAVAALAAMSALIGILYWTRFSGRELTFVMGPRSEVAAYGIFLSAALMIHFRERGMPQLPVLVCPALLCLGLALHWWSFANPVRTVLGVGSFALAINLLPASAPALKAALSIRPLRQLGIWSFSIYVWQQPFYRAIDDGMPRWLALMWALVAGVASYYLVEGPARRYLNRVWGAGARDSRQGLERRTV